MKAAVMEIVGQHFRPEFINRVDEIVVFHPLGREHIRRIVEIQVGYLRKRLAERDIGLVLDDAARDQLGEGVRSGVRRPAAQARSSTSSRTRSRTASSRAISHRATIKVSARDGALQFAKRRDAPFPVGGASACTGKREASPYIPTDVCPYTNTSASSAAITTKHCRSFDPQLRQCLNAAASRSSAWCRRAFPAGRQRLVRDRLQVGQGSEAQPPREG